MSESVVQSVSQSSQLVQMLPITENTILFVLLLRSSGCLQQKPISIRSFEGNENLQLPHYKTLKQIIKDGSEKDGIDDEYLYGQHKTYVRYQKEREEEGHPRPLGVGVMMWDEVKVRISIYTQFQG